MSTAAVMIGFAALAGAAMTPASPTATARVTAAQLFGIADEAAARGDDVMARRAYEVLLTDPSSQVSLEARFRLAMLDAKHGNFTQAAVLLRQVVDARPSATRARLELASILDKMGDNDGAWRQLRAIHASGLPASAARLIDRYSQALRARRSVGASLEIDIAPDTNINRATRSDTLATVLGDFQISDSGKAKSGIGLSLNAQAFRRLALGADTAVLVRASGFANLYPRGEFNDLAVDVAVGPEFNLGRDRLQVEVGAMQRWFGQNPFLRSARAAATYSHALGGQMVVRLAGSAALLDNQRDNLEDGHAFSVQVNVERALSATMGLAVSFAADRQNLRDPGYSTTGWHGGLNLWRDVDRVTLTGGVDIGRLRADERLLLFPERRSDRYSRFSLGATFRQLQWRGFAPIARFSIERNRSTIAFYDYRRRRTEMGIVRAF